MIYFHKFHGIKSVSMDLNGTPNNTKSEMIANCVTWTLKDRGLLTKCCILWWRKNTNFGRISCSGSKSISHALKHVAERTGRCWLSSTHASELYLAQGEHVVWTENASLWSYTVLSPYIHTYSKNRKCQWLLWIRWYKLQAICCQRAEQDGCQSSLQ